MSTRHFLLVTGARMLPRKVAVGPEFPSCGVGLAKVSAAINGRDGKLIEITPDQWQFLRGVYAMNPDAPSGLPHGDNAVLAQDRGDPNGLLFFVDGDKSCAPMPAPRSLLSLMEQVAMAEPPVPATGDGRPSSSAARRDEHSHRKDCRTAPVRGAQPTEPRLRRASHRAAHTTAP